MILEGKTLEDLFDRTFYTISEIKDANRAIGNYWFTKDSMRFFNSRVLPVVYCGHYFISSEQDGTKPRFYTIRFAMSDGSIETVGDFQQYSTAGEAKKAIKTAKKRANSQKDMLEMLNSKEAHILLTL